MVLPKRTDTKGIKIDHVTGIITCT